MTRKSLILLAGLGSLLPAPAARAGTFDVVACDAAPGFANNSWRPEVSHGGMTTFTACPSSDNPRLGLGARNNYYPTGYTVPSGAAARWWFDAPARTSIVGVRANGHFEQLNHRWQVGLSNGAQLLAGCPWTPGKTGASCYDGMSAAEYLPVPASGSIYTEVFCAYGPCPVGGGSYWAWASLTWVAVTLQDDTAPAVGNAGGELWTESWIGGTRRVSFDASDNTGIRDIRALVDGRELARDFRGCDPTARTCPDWPGAALEVATGNGIADGKHSLRLEAIDRAGNAGAVARDIFIDNTPPAAPQDLVVDGGDGWKPANSFKLVWKNPSQNAAPIAGGVFKLCPAATPTDGCVVGERSGSNVSEIKDLSVPTAGNWILSLWLKDAAGNAKPETAAPPLHLRFDPDPPVLALRDQDPEDPARVRVEGSDAISGLARAEIEVRRHGTNAWRGVPAAIEPSGFSAMLDDEHLRDGIYELRARAWDGAGNERSTDRRASGAVAKVTLPLRVKTKLRVGKRVKVRARSSRGRRTRIVYVRRPLVSQGKRVRIRGRLTAPGGNPMAAADLEVGARLAVSGVDFQPVATLNTSRSGRFTYLVPAGPARVLRFRYVGAAKIRPQTREVHVRVRASSSIKANRRRVVNGEPVTFSGRLRGGYLPGSGKLLELQFFDRGKWRTFRTFRADPSSGRWSYTYRFDGTRGTRRYRFRLRIPKENGYPYSTGGSRRTAVTVRGL
jgi:hypothetical protein